MKGEEVLKKFKTVLREVLPKNILPRFIYKGTKLGSFFSVKDKVDVTHLSGLVYAFTPKNKLEVDYVGETNVRWGRRTDEHSRWDTNSSIYKYGQETGIEISFEDFKIVERGYPKCVDRKIAEALYIKDFQPSLNGQKQSYKLKLFN